MEKNFKAYLIKLAANEIIYLQRERRGGRLPNGSVGTIINNVTSMAPTITINTIMIKLTIMDKAKKAAVTAPP